jgi:hypothetical protein
MIQSLPRAAGCYATTIQFLRELREAMRQRASIREYHWGAIAGRPAHDHWMNSPRLRTHTAHFACDDCTFVASIHRAQTLFFLAGAAAFLTYARSATSSTPKRRRASALPIVAQPRVPEEISVAVGEKQRRDEIDAAELINRGVPTASVTTGADGGMNPAFAAAKYQVTRKIRRRVWYPSNFYRLARAVVGFDDMNCKSNQIRAAWAAGDQIGALRIAARFFDRSIETRTFKRGIGAYNNPDFYRQLGKDPQQIVADALDVLAKRFNLQ